MYQEYFGLTEKPFSETPDPKFFYLSPKHREGLAHLEYNILDGKGFTVLCGEVGAGKTTLCRALVERLDTEKITFAHVTHTNLNFHEFLREVVDELGISVQEQQKWDLLKALNKYLLEVYSQNRKVVLIVDEAQNLALSALEGIRMLSNLETPKEKLIQIIFVGQPRFMDNLQRPEMLQLKQRIASYFFLGSLSEKETKEYISFRLSCVQSKPSLRFTPDALDLIYRITGGIPRLINFLCDFSVMQAFVAGTWTIGPLLVQKADTEIKGPQSVTEHGEGKEKRMESNIQGIRGKEGLGNSSFRPLQVPEVQPRGVDMEGTESSPVEGKSFFFPKTKSLWKRIALILGLVLIFGGLGSLVLWRIGVFGSLGGGPN